MSNLKFWATRSSLVPLLAATVALVACSDDEPVENTVTPQATAESADPVLAYVEADEIEPTPRSLLRGPGPTPDALSEVFFLEVLSPDHQTSFADGPSVAVSGRSRVDAVVSVNDTLAELDEDGAFEVVESLVEGPNLIEVVASVDGGETQTSAVLTVFYLP